MNKYEITIIIDGHWGTKYKNIIVFADDEDEAENKGMDYLDRLQMIYDENSWGAYEEASIEDITRIA